MDSSTQKGLVGNERANHMAKLGIMEKANANIEVPLLDMRWSIKKGHIKIHKTD